MAENKEPTYTREQILESERFRENRDLVDALMVNKTYTISEVERLVQNYMKGKVK